MKMRSARLPWASTAVASLSMSAGVGTGFSVNVAQELYDTLSAMEQSENSFDDELTAEERRGLVYVRPELVAEVAFQAWSPDGNLRHAAFRGLRQDKAPEDVMPEATSKTAQELPQSSVTLTHPDRIYWPEEGITKQGLASYYARVWRFIEPYVTKRPLALLRCPDGIGGQRFFQKHAWKGMNSNIEQITDPKDKGGGEIAAHHGLRRDHCACPVRGAGDPSLGCHDRQLGTARHDHDGS